MIGWRSASICVLPAGRPGRCRAAVLIWAMASEINHNPIDRYILRMGKVDCMEIASSYEQRARIELLSLVAGTTPGEMLMDAAMLLLDRDAGCCERCRQTEIETTFCNEQVEVRFAQLLGR